MLPVSSALGAVLTELGDVRRLRAGERLLGDGTGAGVVLLVRSGSLRVTVTDPGGDEVTVAVIGPGQLLGNASAHLDSGGRASVEAREPGEVVVIAASRYTRLVMRDRDHAAEATRRIGQIALESGRRRIRSVTAPLGRRVAAELCGLFPATETGPVTVGITHGELADLAGGSRGAVVSALDDLERDGVLTAGDSTVTVLDPCVLRARSYETAAIPVT
jgi:CRP/FNR family cyclic AMP-dependent transcriptional regulator